MVIVVKAVESRDCHFASANETVLCLLKLALETITVEDVWQIDTIFILKKLTNLCLTVILAECNLTRKEDQNVAGYELPAADVA